MRILITGGTGFVGRHLVKALLSRQHSICLLTRNLTRTGEMVKELDPQHLHLIDTTADDWKGKIKESNPDVVIHLATYSTSADSEEAISQLISNNITFGTHLLDALKQTSIKAFINTGTFAEYAKNSSDLIPAYLYAASKTAYRSIVEYYRYLKRFKVVNVIPYTIYGGLDSRKKLIDYIYDSFLSGEPVRMSPGEQVLDLIHVNDVVDLYLSLIENVDQLDDESCELHLGTGVGSTPRQIASLLSDITKRTPNIVWGGIPYRVTDTMYSVSPTSKLATTIGWQPKIELKEGLEMYVKILVDNNLSSLNHTTKHLPAN